MIIINKNKDGDGNDDVKEKERERVVEIKREPMYEKEKNYICMREYVPVFPLQAFFLLRLSLLFIFLFLRHGGSGF